MKDPLDQDRTIDIDELNTQKVQTVGYIRVSTAEQNTDRQLDGIALDRIFTDKIMYAMAIQSWYIALTAWLEVLKT